MMMVPLLSPLPFPYSFYQPNLHTIKASDYDDDSLTLFLLTFSCSSYQPNLHTIKASDYDDDSLTLFLLTFSCSSP